MRYEKGHKEATRQKIVETAAARFRKDGIEGVGLADLMAEAGLTHGGFYSHFSSKEDLVRAAVEEASCVSSSRFAKRTEEEGLEGWIRYYLHAGHRDHPERGCVAAALVGELARRPGSTREPFTENLSKVISSISGLLPGRQSPETKRRTAIAIFSTLIGALQMARAVSDPALSKEILEAGTSSALALAQIKTVER